MRTARMHLKIEEAHNSRIKRRARDISLFPEVISGHRASGLLKVLLV
jgi:hypothetical protein